MYPIHTMRAQLTRTLIATASLLALSASWAGAAHARQATPAPPAAAGGPNEIVVTARFINTGASSATKLNIRVLDTPFTVTAYNKNFLKAIEATNVSDLYRYMNGVQRAGNTGYDITFRGFKTSANDRNALLTDGLPGLTVRFGSPPTIGVDHIELVKGPSSVLYGQAQPGGFINIISKKPQDVPAFAFGLTGETGAGRYDRERGGIGSVDVTGPITKDGALTARLVAEGEYSDGFRDFGYTHSAYVAPSVTWKVAPRTSITASAEYRWLKTNYDTFLIAPNRDATRIAPINTIYQEPNDFLIEHGATGNLFIRHEFSKSLKFNLGYRHVSHYDTQTNLDVVGFRDPADTIVTRRARGQINKRSYDFVDANLTGNFDTFGLRHTMLLGVNGGRETASLDRTRFYNCTGKACNSLDISLYNPVHGAYPSPSSFPLYNVGQASNLNWRYTTQNSLGFYGSDLITFSRMFKAMVGLRYADETQNLADKRITTFVPAHKASTKVLPFAGLMFEPTQHVTFYTSYSTSYVPADVSAQDNFGNNPFVPTYASSIEGGIKADLFNRRLNITTDYFDITQKNVLNTFNCLTQAQLIAAGITIPTGATIASGTCSDQVGRARSHGVELDLNATPLPGWQITAGYSHTLARITGSDKAYQIGARLTNAPDDTLNLWTRYDIATGALKNLGFGLGVSYIGKRAGLLPTQFNDPRPENGTLPLAAYTTVDAAIYYQVSKNVDVTLKVTNLFDKRYLESAGFTGDINLVPGMPRLLTLSVLSHF